VLRQISLLKEEGMKRNAAFVVSMECVPKESLQRLDIYMRNELRALLC
jgi:hypothetical protein